MASDRALQSHQFPVRTLPDGDGHRRRVSWLRV